MDKASKSSVRRRASPDVGRPSAARGSAFQLDFSVLKSLLEIGSAKANPLQPRKIRIEPRDQDESGERELRWDLGLDGSQERFECKIQLRTKHVVQWLEAASKQGRGRKAVLVYATCDAQAERAIKAVSRARQLAFECGSNETEYVRLLAISGIRATEQLDNLLKTVHSTTLKNVSFRRQEGAEILETSNFLAMELFGGAHARGALSWLRARLGRAEEYRELLDAHELIDEMESAGLPMLLPQALSGSASLAQRVLLTALEIAPECFPREALCIATGLTPADVSGEVSTLVNRGFVRENRGFYSRTLRRITFSGEPNIREESLGFALDSIVKLVRGPYTIEHTRIRTWDACKLAYKLGSALFATHPSRVANLFPELDHIVKGTGDKRLVLDIARLSLRAAERAMHELRNAERGAGWHESIRSLKRAQARCLICGHAWVLQRLGPAKLREALANAKDSRTIAEDLGIEETIAFCFRCEGRIYRMLAEARVACASTSDTLNDAAAEVATNLRMSEQLLRLAIDRFSSLPQFGDSSAEVGECYSLLGRTMFVRARNSRSYREASEARDQYYHFASEAARRLTDRESKEYLDLQILRGDFILDVERGESANLAAERYQEAYDGSSRSGFEYSEIRARAARGLMRCDFLRKRTSSAKKWMSIASSIWREASEYELSADVRWEFTVKAKRASADAIEYLSRYPTRVRVACLEMIDGRQARDKHVTARRTPRITRSVCMQLIHDARHRVALESSDSEWARS